jgi:hypothetical protein
VQSGEVAMATADWAVEDNSWAGLIEWVKSTEIRKDGVEL